MSAQVLLMLFVLVLGGWREDREVFLEKPREQQGSHEDVDLD